MYNKSVVNVYKYSDYREFLREYISDGRKLKKSVSFRALSKRAGFSSPNFIKLVVDGQRNLTIESAEKLVKALDLNYKSKKFFIKLVRFNQTNNINKKYHAAQNLLQSELILNRTQYLYYKNWYNIPLRESLLFFDIFQYSEWLILVKKLFPFLSNVEISESFKIFEVLGLVEKVGIAQWKASSSILKTGDQISESLILYFHKKMIEMAIEALTKYDFNSREIGAITVGLSKESFEIVRKKIRRLKNEILKISDRDKMKTRICEVNIQLFPLSEEMNNEK